MRILNYLQHTSDSNIALLWCDKWLPLLLSSDCFCFSYLCCNSRNIAKVAISKANPMLAGCNHSYFILSLETTKLELSVGTITNRGQLVSLSWVSTTLDWREKACSQKLWHYYAVYITFLYLEDLLVMNVNLRSIQFIKRCILIKVTSFFHQIITLAKGFLRGMQMELHLLCILLVYKFVILTKLCKIIITTKEEIRAL